MIAKYVQRNKYGGYTWQVKVDSLFHLYIHSSNNNACFVEFKEWKVLWYKTHFTFSTDKGLKNAIDESFEKIYYHFSNSKNYHLSISQKDNMKDKVLYYMRNDLTHENDIKIKLGVRTDGYYVAKHSGIGLYGNSFEITIFLFFNEKNRVYYEDREGKVNLNEEDASEIIEKISEVINTSHTIAEYRVHGKQIDMTFYGDEQRLFFTQWIGQIYGESLILNCIHQSYSYADKEVEKTTDIEGLKFTFVKCQ